MFNPGERLKQFARGAHGSVPLDGNNLNGSARQGDAVARYCLTKDQDCAARRVEFRFQLQQVVDKGWRAELYLQPTDDEYNSSRGGKGAVMESKSPQPFRSAALEKAQIGGMVDPT